MFEDNCCPAISEEFSRSGMWLCVSVVCVSLCGSVAAKAKHLRRLVRLGLSWKFSLTVFTRERMEQWVKWNCFHVLECEPEAIWFYSLMRLILSCVFFFFSSPVFFSVSNDMSNFGNSWTLKDLAFFVPQEDRKAAVIFELERWVSLSWVSVAWMELQFRVFMSPRIQSETILPLLSLTQWPQPC